MVLLRQLRKRRCDRGESLNEFSVVVGQAEEGLYLLNRSWGWPISNRLCLLRIRSEAFCAYNVPEELDFLFVKFAFL
jgi:hypothetical protein